VLHILVLIIQQLITYEFAYIVPQQICDFQSCAALWCQYMIFPRETYKISW